MKSKKFGLIEILYRDGTSDSFYASVGLYKKIGEEMLKGDCLIKVQCQNRKGIEFFSADVNKISMCIDMQLMRVTRSSPFINRLPELLDWGQPNEKPYSKPQICEKCEFAERSITRSPCKACYGYYFKPMQSERAEVDG